MIGEVFIKSQVAVDTLARLLDDKIAVLLSKTLGSFLEHFS